MSLPAVDFEYLRQLVRSHSAIAIDPGKAYLAESRLTPLIKQHGCASLQEFLRLLQSQSFSAVHREAVAAMANHETWFFRDAAPFAALSDVVIPELLRKRAPAHRIAIWSAACSTGQEPYSIAMLLCESLGPGRNRFSILATDFCQAALERAASGMYRQMEVNRGLPAWLLTRYFAQHGLYWQLKPEIAGKVSFRPLNLAASWPAMPLMDVIFLRNVLIYFDAESRRQVLARVHRVLRPDGFLFLGSAETPWDLENGFEAVEAGNYRCYKPKPLGTR